MPSTLDFKCAIVTGGAGGIGKAMAEYLLKQGKEVILVGRTESNLQKTQKEIGATAHYVLDTGDVDSDAIPTFVAKVTKDYPQVDCLINNAGIQQPLYAATDSASTFFSKGSTEMNVNIRGPISLSLHLLPHFKALPYACIMNVTSGLAYTPFLASCPVYNATKAFMHSFTLNLRSQLENDESTKHIKIIEIVPPMVATDLHRDHTDPDNNKKENNPRSMSIEEFMADLTAGWEKGDTTVGAGMAKMAVKTWFETFGGMYEKNKTLHS